MNTINPFLLLTLLITFFSAMTVSAEAIKTSVQISTPMQYKAISSDQLGINEKGKGLSLGTSIKSLTINDLMGKPYPLQTAWQQQAALIIFYRGGWCPFCNMQIREITTHANEFKAAGVQPILISVDTPDISAMVSAKYKIPFPVLSDPELVAHKVFNVVLTADANTLKKYKEYGIDLSLWSGKNHHSIAVASAFLIDKNGKVLFSHAPEDYSSRPSAKQLLMMIKQHL